MQPKFRQSIVIFNIMLFSVSLVFSQAPTTRSINEKAFKATGFWYDSTTAMFQVKYPILQSVPPLSTTMPYTVMQSYIYLDSLARFGEREVDSVTRAWTTLNDTLKGAVKHLYEAVDYNPITFTQYLGEVNLRRKIDTALRFSTPYDSTFVYTGSSIYTVNLHKVRLNLEEKFRKVLNPDTNRLGLYSILNSDYILRIKVISIDSTLNKLSNLGYKRYQVTAEVLDTLKGKVLPPYQPNTLIKQKDDKPLESESAVIQFEYTPINYYSSDIYRKKDSAFLNSKGKFKMEVNQEAVVFLIHINQLFTDQHDYFNLDLNSRGSFNALPIENGQVRDVNGIWSSNLWLPYNDWKFKFNELKLKIINKNY